MGGQEKRESIKLDTIPLTKKLRDRLERDIIALRDRLIEEHKKSPEAVLVLSKSDISLILAVSFYKIREFENRLPSIVRGASADMAPLPQYPVVDAIKGNASEFGKGLADTFLIGLSGAKFRVEGMSPERSGVFNGSDINYVAVGMVYAANRDSSQTLMGDIDSYNRRQNKLFYIWRALKGGDKDHDIKQIPGAQKWAKLGYEFYNQNAIK